MCTIVVCCLLSVVCCLLSVAAVAVAAVAVAAAAAAAVTVTAVAVAVAAVAVVVVVVVAVVVTVLQSLRRLLLPGGHIQQVLSVELLWYSDCCQLFPNSSDSVFLLVDDICVNPLISDSSIVLDFTICAIFM